MPRMAPHARRDARHAGGAAEDLPRELDFETGDERQDRDGVAQPQGETLERLQAPSGATGSGDSDDDLSPQMLLREDRSRAADTLLSNVDESAIGEGHGLDEAEWAEVQPVGRATRAKSAPRHPPKAKPAAVQKKAAAARKPSG